VTPPTVERLSYKRRKTRRGLLFCFTGSDVENAQRLHHKHARRGGLGGRWINFLEGFVLFLRLGKEGVAERIIERPRSFLSQQRHERTEKEMEQNKGIGHIGGAQIRFCYRSRGKQHPRGGKAQSRKDRVRTHERKGKETTVCRSNQARALKCIIQSNLVFLDLSLTAISSLIPFTVIIIVIVAIKKRFTSTEQTVPFLVSCPGGLIHTYNPCGYRKSKNSFYFF